MRILNSLGCLLALTSPGWVTAQPSVGPTPLTLVTARRLAMERSGERAARAARLAGDQARARQAGALSNPQFAVRTERTGADDAAANQLIAEVSQQFDLAGVAGQRRAAATARAIGSAASLTAARADVELEVTIAYLRAVLADHRLALANRTLAAFDRAAAISTERRNAGDISGLAHRRLGLEAARVAALRAGLTLGRRTERLRLAALVSESGRPLRPDDWFLVDSVIPSAPVGDSLESLIALALRDRAELRQLESVIGATAAEVTAERRASLPTPAITAGLKSERVATGRQSGFVAGLSFALPLFDRRAGAVAAATADRDEAVARLDQERRIVAREVTATWESLQAIESQRQALLPRLGADAQAALGAAEVAFTEGEIGVVEWLDTIRAYSDAETMLLVLTTEAALERSRLDWAVGRFGRTP